MNENQPKLETDDYTDELTTKLINSLQAKILINMYIVENIVLGKISPGEKIPFDRYIKEINIEHLVTNSIREYLYGDILDENEYIRIKPAQDYYFSFFTDNINNIFESAPQYTSKLINNKIDSFDELSSTSVSQSLCTMISSVSHLNTKLASFKYGLKDYLYELYPLFYEITQTEVEPDLFEPTYTILDRVQAVFYHKAASKFICAIKTKGLRQGSRVDRYIKEMPYISEYIDRLLKRDKGHYLLKDSNTDDLNYKLALLSCFSYYNLDNAKLFELKMKAWEEHR